MTFQFWIPIIAVILLAVAYMAYERTTPRVGGRLRLILTSMRVASFMCLVLVFLDPRCVRTVEQEEKAKVLALVDRSASMALPVGAWGEAKPRARFDAARGLLREFSDRFAQAGGEVETVYFSNGVSPAPGRGDSSPRPEGSGSPPHPHNEATVTKPNASAIPNSPVANLAPRADLEPNKFVRTAG